MHRSFSNELNARNCVKRERLACFDYILKPKIIPGGSRRFFPEFTVDTTEDKDRILGMGYMAHLREEQKINHK